MPSRNYKMKIIWRDLEKPPQPKEGKDTSKAKGDEVRKKLKWNVSYKDALKSLQERNNLDAHPIPLTEEILVERQNSWI